MFAGSETALACIHVIYRSATPKLAFSQVSPCTPKEPMTLEAMLRLLRMVWRRHGWLRHRQEPAKWRRPPPAFADGRSTKLPVGAGPSTKQVRSCAAAERLRHPPRRRRELA